MKREEKRTPLQCVIPLDTPYVVHIETNNACNFRCKFCFESNDELLEANGIKRGFMQDETFYKIIDDLAKFPNKAKRILFHVAGEPLLHKSIINFISYAKKKDVANELVMFTNGALLSHELSKKLVESGIDIIQISVEGVTSDKYYEITNRRVDYGRFVENIGYLYSIKSDSVKLHTKIIDTGLSEYEKQKFFDDFQNKSDECYIENILDVCPDDVMDTTMGLGASYTQEGKALKEKTVCTVPFYVLVINYDGNVDACSCDWRRNLIMGNVNRDSLFDIWNGKKFSNFRKIQLEGQRKKCLACSDCKAIQYQLDDIDNWADELRMKLI